MSIKRETCGTNVNNRSVTTLDLKNNPSYAVKKHVVKKNMQSKFAVQTDILQKQNS